jgi:AAA domain
MDLDLKTLARALGGHVSSGQVMAPGPGHSATDRSLSIKLSSTAPEGFVVHSFAGDDPIVCRDYVKEKCEIVRPDKSNGHRAASISDDAIDRALRAAVAAQQENSPKGVVVARYDYRDGDGTLLYQVLRYEPKDFRFSYPNGSTNRRVLYRWPELLKYPSGTTFVTEGEKDADRVASIKYCECATTVASGKWTDECIRALAGRDCLILEDNDETGRKKALEAATRLHGVANTIRIVRLPGLRDREDVSDWLDADPRNAGKLVDICFDTPLWQPDESKSSDEPSPGHNGPPPDEVDVSNYICLGDAPAKPPEELIKGLVPKEGVVVTGGQSSAGKTFIKIYKAVCLATGTAYFGHKIIERVGTVFVAAEGRPLLPNRFAATLAKLSVTEKLPIMWPKRLPDFSCADGIKRFVLELKEIDRRYRGDFGVRMGHIPIDTVAANFAMKDEDDNAEATKICNILRSIGEETGALMAPVHHYGKSAISGLRGASAWTGSADVIEGVLADIDPLSGKVSNRELVCAKARDGEQGPIAPFNLEFIELGLNDDNEIYGSCCVVPAERESRLDKGPAPSKSQRTIIDAINEALDNYGKIITPRAGMPQLRAVKVSDVRTEFDRRYIVADTDPAKVADAKRKAFKRALDCLSPAKFGAGSAEGTDWIWKIT